MGGNRVELQMRFEREAVPLIGRVFRMARLLTRDDNDAEDLVQDTYVRALQRFDQFKEGTNLVAWLNRIAYTQFVNGFHKKSLRRAEVLREDEVAPSNPDADAAAEFADALLSPAMREQMDQNTARALDRLSPELREVLILCAVGEFRYADAADKLDVPVGTVMSRLSRAKAFMRDELLRLTPNESSPAGTGERK